jgi:hypothetical protein
MRKPSRPLGVREATNGRHRALLADGPRGPAAAWPALRSERWYGVLSPFEARAPGPAAVERGRPSPRKALLELLRSVLVAAVVAGVARTSHLHTVGSETGKTAPARVTWVSSGSWVPSLLRGLA